MLTNGHVYMSRKAVGSWLEKAAVRHQPVLPWRWWILPARAMFSWRWHLARRSGYAIEEAVDFASGVAAALKLIRAGGRAGIPDCGAGSAFLCFCII